MPKRQEVKTVMIISSGPIVIGQGCEFDYSGTQACKALREEGIRVVLLNSNPATIMTDPELADRTYIEPITPETIDKILARESELGTPIDALLPTLGGQTGLNCAVRAAEMGILDKHHVVLIGANLQAIQKAENRTEFKEAMVRIGLDIPRSGIAHSWQEAQAVIKEVNLPVAIRPAYTLGGTGGGFAFTPEEFETIVKRGLEYSLNSEILIEESCLGWKEYELEVMRDRADNVVIICSIENFDPMGVHTGDSITVAPAQTLTDKEYQLMRDAAIRIIREIGVETGGSNIQFAVHPETGRMIVIEMNPRVSRSSALASKATGYPIARIAAKLAIGYTLDELPNDITKKTPASFEPTIDYCVVKIPRWTFEKFPEADETLTTQMKSVGEAMSIGRTFKEALQKGIRSMEIKRFGLGLDSNDKWLAHLRSTEGVRGRGAEGEKNDAGTRGRGDAAKDEPRPSALRPRLEEGLSPRFHLTNTSADIAIKDSRAAEPPADTQEESASKWPVPLDRLRDKLARPCQGRLYYIRYAFKMGWTLEQVHELSKIDPWFLDNVKELVEFEDELLQAAGTGGALNDSHAGLIRRAKCWGYSNVQLATVFKVPHAKMREFCCRHNIRAVYKLVDTCAAEFEAETPYYYSSQESPAHHIQAQAPALDCDDEIRVSEIPKVIVLGGGPNRIGQGIEFDYCCVHAVMTARDMGYETVMINSNPETVSTDYDTSDLLFFEPLTHEDVLNVCERLNGNPFVDSSGCGTGVPVSELCGTGVSPVSSSSCGTGVSPVSSSSCGTGVSPVHAPSSTDMHRRDAGATPQNTGETPVPHQTGLEQPGKEHQGLIKGVIVQFGGQTPLNLAKGLQDAGVPILGTSPENIHLAEDREAFRQILDELGLRQPASGIAYDLPGAIEVANRIGYPVLVRPSYVLGGRAMEKCHIEADLTRYMATAMNATDRKASTDEKHPILIDQFLSQAIEVDVDCVSDGQRVVVCGVMEHIEEAGIHSGDSACALPPYSLSMAVIDEIKRQTELLAKRLNVHGLMNVQYAVKDEVVYVLEVNPRASRTVPFVSKATGVPWAKLATQVMLGQSLDLAMSRYGITDAPQPAHVSVKEAVFPFSKFPGVDAVLGPEMRSTGEVMGIDATFPIAFAKSQMAAGVSLPRQGTVLISVNDHDKPLILPVARMFAEMGFDIISTRRTRDALEAAGIEATLVSKIQDPTGPYLIDLIHEGKVDLLINTPIYWGSAAIESRIRSAAIMHNLPLITTMAGARAAVQAIRALREGDWEVRALQDYQLRR